MSNRAGVTPGRGGNAAGFISELAAGPALFIGKIETTAGACALTRSGGIPVQIKLGDPVCQGDVIETAADGRVGIRFVDGTTFSLSNSARMVVKEFADDEASPSARFDVTQGAFRFIAGATGNAGRFDVDTPFANIRGRTQSSGIGMLSLAALFFAAMEEVQASSNGASTDGDTITCKVYGDVRNFHGHDPMEAPQTI